MVNSLVSLKELMMGPLPGESTLKPQIQTIKDTVEIVLRVAHIIMELKGFQTWVNIITESHINETIIWMVTAVIHCDFTVSEFYSGYSLIPNEKSEQMDTQKKIEQYYQELKRDICFYRRREAEIQVKSNYQNLFDLLLYPPARNIDILCYFISSNIDGKILNIPGSKEQSQQTTLRSFDKNNVLILYSSFANETFKEELSLVKRLHNITNTKFGYKIVWVPIAVQKTDDKKYKAITGEMSYCYTLTFEAVQQVNSSLVHLLKKDWGFTGKPMLVVLDDKGRVVRQNALLMLDLYGDEAFPFTTERENELLPKKPMGMQLLQEIDTTISDWLKSKEQYVCLYGGDIEWCKNMVNSLQIFTDKGNIKVEKAYVGWNSPHKTKVEEILAPFKTAKLGHIMEYSISKKFWEHLQNDMLHFSTHDSHDASKKFLSWAVPLLIFGKRRDTWVAIGNADNVVVFRGSVFLNGLNIILENFKEWESTVTTDSFLEQLSKRLDDINKEQGNKDHCHKLEIAGSPALIKGDLHCPTCDKLMQLTMMYKCCTTEN